MKSNLVRIYGKVDRCALAYDEYIQKFASKIVNAKVLDVGCGLGNYTSYFCGRGNKVTGIDIQDFRDKYFLKKFHYIKCSAAQTPFKSHTFDLVVCLDVIEHIEEDFKTAKEIFRVLKNSGKIFVATPNRERLSVFVGRLLGRNYSFPHVGQESGFGGRSVHVREYSSQELLSLFLRAGFKNLKIDFFWLGIRGKINVGIKSFFMKSLCQYLFLTNE